MTDVRMLFAEATKVERMSMGLGGETFEVNLGDRPKGLLTSASPDESFRYDEPEEMAKVFKVLHEEVPGVFREDDPEDGE